MRFVAKEMGMVSCGDAVMRYREGDIIKCIVTVKNTDQWPKLASYTKWT